jgi:sterol desaturase/sphingolipid hydroxylase (fatty acid hydroxylase superfamily)
VGNTVLLAAAVGAGGAALSAVTGAPVGAVVPTAIAAAAVGLGAYEWVHLLVHTGYPGRRAWYRALRAQHRLHHYRDDGTGFGITARWVDRALGTAPARPGGAGRSPAARAG